MTRECHVARCFGGYLAIRKVMRQGIRYLIYLVRVTFLNDRADAAMKFFPIRP